MKPVVTAETRIIQIRYAKAGETVSYGATQTLSRDTVIAVCATGYADGFHRASGQGVPCARQESRRQAAGCPATGCRCSGRVTMDFTMSMPRICRSIVLDKAEMDRALRQAHQCEMTPRGRRGRSGMNCSHRSGWRYHRRIAAPSWLNPFGLRIH